MFVPQTNCRITSDSPVREIECTLRSVEEVRLADGHLVFNEADPAAQVVRLYHAALDRDPEQQGLNFWIGQLREGHGLLDLAQSFLASPEFNSRYGSLTDSQYVDRLYQNVLGREGEAAGWIASALAMAMTRFWAKAARIPCLRVRARIASRVGWAMIR